MTVSEALKKAYAKPNGREKDINDVVFYGVSAKPYASVSELKKAKCRYAKGKNSAWGHPTRANLKKLLQWLLKTDGYLR